MKKLSILFLIASTLLISCDENPNDLPSKKTVKQVTKTVNTVIDESDMKKIDKEKLKKEAKKIQKELERLRKEGKKKVKK